MQKTVFPPVEQLLPHGETMVLLDKVLSHDDQKTECSVVITPGSLFFDDIGTVPTWVGLEYMAQCIATHAGLIAKANGKEIQIGYWVGSRKITFNTDCFYKDQSLNIQASKVWQDDHSGSFDCHIKDQKSGKLLLDGLLTVFLP